MFLLNEDHADCLDTWNPVVLRLQLWRENDTQSSSNKQVRALFSDITPHTHTHTHGEVIISMLENLKVALDMSTTQ